MGVFLMKKLLLTSIAALSVLSASAAHTREWQGSMPKPVGKLPAYPPVVCVAPDWAVESCEDRSDNWLAAMTRAFRWLHLIETTWMGTVEGPRPWNGVWPKHTTVLYDEHGGILDKHIVRWKELAASGNNVEIRGYCSSACTMIMAYVPSDRICFGDNSALGFHMSRGGYGENYETFKPFPETARWMVNQYPQNIRKWVNDRGGAEKMKVEEFWVLDAPTLWQMGYRKCSPEPIDLGDQLRWRERDKEAEEAYKEWIKTREIPPLYPHTRPNS